MLQPTCVQEQRLLRRGALAAFAFAAALIFSPLLDALALPRNMQRMAFARTRLQQPPRPPSPPESPSPPPPPPWNLFDTIAWPFPTLFQFWSSLLVFFFLSLAFCVYLQSCRGRPTALVVLSAQPLHPAKRFSPRDDPPQEGGMPDARQPGTLADAGGGAPPPDATRSLSSLRQPPSDAERREERRPERALTAFEC